MVLPGFRDGTGLDDLYACVYKYPALYFLSSSLITGGQRRQIFPVNSGNPYRTVGQKNCPRYDFLLDKTGVGA